MSGIGSENAVSDGSSIASTRDDRAGRAVVVEQGRLLREALLAHELLRQVPVAAGALHQCVTLPRNFTDPAIERHGTSLPLRSADCDDQRHERGNRSRPGRFRGHNGNVRADRLVAILLMLQARGQVTAAEVADELEISERTARRDLEALGMAGLPIYSRQGRNGGWQLAGGGRTDLSGLNAAEARALVPRRRYLRRRRRRS